MELGSGARGTHGSMLHRIPLTGQEEKRISSIVTNVDFAWLWKRGKTTLVDKTFPKIIVLSA